MSVIRNIFDSIGKFFQTEDEPDASWEFEISHEDMVMGYAHAINDQAIAMRGTAGDNEAFGIIDRVLDMLKTANDTGIDSTEIYEVILKIRERY
jgi:hypothetical protein